MFRKFLVLSLVVALLFVAYTPAKAITYGVPDGNDHPYVGSMVLQHADGSLHQWCSGTLIAPKVFMTASHCTIDMDSYLAERPGSAMLVTFDPVISTDSTFYSGQMITNPAYITATGYDDPGDVAVILLTVAPEGITPAQLPSAWLLEQLKDDHTLDNTLFTAVGYGTVRVTNRTAQQGFLDNNARNRVDQSFLSLTNAWVTFSMNLATGNGGTCYGDSGGPHFIHKNGVETNIVVAVTVSGDAVCKATDKDYRVDTVSARSFLGKYVTLPETEIW